MWGKVRQTHRVVGEESHQLIAQNKSGCENLLYKGKRKKEKEKKANHFLETSSLGREGHVPRWSAYGGACCPSVPCGAWGQCCWDPEGQSLSGTKQMTFLHFLHL